MPSTERPLGAEDTPLLKFAGDLRRLRRRAGTPSYRELGRRAHYSAAALAEATAGRRLPSLAVTRAFVRECGGDVAEWTERWRDLSAVPERVDDAPPYVGLAAYQAEDAERFFGREAVVASLLELVRERPFVGVFGASGSGKSSLLRAGLVASWDSPATVVTPGSDPITALALRIAALLDRPVADVRSELAAGTDALRTLLRRVGDDVLLVVDQFEEAFTHCTAADRAWLIEALTRTASTATRVVVCVRADFYGHCGQYPELSEALHRAQLLVGPMTADELRRAVTGPAAQRGVSVESALLARLVADVSGQPGALPLVSHVLVETWRRRRGMVLTLAGYQDAGGVEHALARSADEVHDALPPDLRSAVRPLFLRLTTPGDATGDTRRRVRRAEIDAPAGLLDQLAAARLLTIDRDDVELTHEALLHAWPKLAAWLDEDRDALRAHRRLTEAADTWRAHDRDPDALYRGARLEQARQLLDRLNAAEREFVDTGVAAERTRHTDRRRSVRRLRRLAAGLIVLVLVLAGTATYAMTAQREATRERNEALSLRAAATADRLLRVRAGDAAALALAAYRVAPTAEARDVVRLAAGVLAADTSARFVLPPGRLTMTWEDTAYRVWTSERRPGGLLPTGTFHYAISADQRRVLLKSTQFHDYSLWDVTDPGTPRQLATLTGWPLVEGIDATGSLLTTIEDGSPAVWHLGDSSRTRLPVPDVERAVPLADGTGVLLVRREGKRRHVESWSLTGSPHRTAVLAERDEPLELTPGPGDLLAMVARDSSRLVVLDQARPVLDVPLGPEQRLIWFSPDGRTIVATGGDQAALWELPSGRELLSLRASGTRFGLARYNPETRELAVIDGGTDHVWNLTVDVERAIRQVCVHPSDVDWDKHFPHVPPRPLCP
ncbi:hypothetical protein JOF56_008654 [Kibdelosporangium banguiense]|uniref:HTH cro/C1-type domain-containing protein n=1 Tax=Kibdelosporangium banguiense TaxID=1365924 RepID=A0ABS4TWB1_9PSEU|nr:hypothetical protein [Kibdelosporangium banguiense]MBP2328269.1 hypothetical protein [Kibdelosporangium banguiense]